MQIPSATKVSDWALVECGYPAPEAPFLLQTHTHMKKSIERRYAPPPNKGNYRIKSSLGDEEICEVFRSRADARKAAIERWGLGGYCWVEVPGQVDTKM